MGIFSKVIRPREPNWDSMYKVYRDEHGKWCIEGRKKSFASEKQALNVREALIESDKIKLGASNG